MKFAIKPENLNLILIFSGLFPEVTFFKGRILPRHFQKYIQRHYFKFRAQFIEDIFYPYHITGLPYVH